MSVAAIILAAGTSRRLEQPKQMVELGGETLLERAALIAAKAGLSPILIVIRVEDKLSAKLRKNDCVVIVNQQAAEGMASSIRCGVGRARALQVEGAVLMTCDQVALRAEHLRALCEQVGSVTGSRYAGKIGIPAYFPTTSFAKLMELQGDIGARELLRDAASVLDEALRLDVDTKEDLARAYASFNVNG